MQQGQVAKWLKGITVLTGIAGLLFFLWVMPVMAESIVEAYPKTAHLKWPGIIYGWVIGVICYAILYQFWRVCVQIGRDNSFSEENSRSFAHISRLAVLMAVIWFAGVVFLAAVKYLGPAIGIFMILVAFICIVAAVLSAALSHLIYKAYEMRQENDLTI